MGLQADGYFLLPARQFVGERVNDIEEAARPIVVQDLGGDLDPVDQDVELAAAAVAAPIGQDQVRRLVRRDAHLEGEPTAAEGVPPLPAAEVSRPGPLA